MKQLQKLWIEFIEEWKSAHLVTDGKDIERLKIIYPNNTQFYDRPQFDDFMKWFSKKDL